METAVLALPVSPPTLEAAGDAPRPVAAPATDRMLYLLGRPTLKQVLRFVKANAVERPSTASLIGRWNRARDLIKELEQTEAGIADAPPIQQLGPEYQEVLIEFLKDPLVKHGFNTVPTEVALIPLDRLVVYQRHIDLGFVAGLQRQLPPTLGALDTFRACLPVGQPRPPAEWCELDRGRFAFRSPSNDLRFLGAMQLDTENLKDYPPPGAVVGIVGLAVGFGSNFLNAIYAEGRLILANGSHRAYALRSLGVTHVPCVVQHVSSRDELELVASNAVRRDPDLFLKAPRPSMLKDYFHPELQLTLQTHRRTRQVTVTFEVHEEMGPPI
jgi:hypothetical protein